MMCANAYDRDECVSLLAAHPEAAGSEPSRLASIGISKALASVSSLFNFTRSLRSTSDGEGEDSALATCESALRDAQDDLQSSLRTLATLNPLKFQEQMADALTLLSAALTDHTTCLDAVNEKAGGTKRNLIDVRARGVTTLLANAVSLVAAVRGIGVNARRRMLVVDDAREEGVWISMRRKLMQSTNNLTLVNAVVAKDGTGQYVSVQAAIDAAPQENAKKWVIYVKQGVYSEHVEVPKSVKNLVVFGDGIGKTVITGDKSVVGSNVTTFATATMSTCALPSCMNHHHSLSLAPDHEIYSGNYVEMAIF